VLFDRRFKVDPSIPHFLYLAMVALTLLSAVLLAATAVAFPSSNERHAARLSGRRNGRGSSLPMNVTVHATEKLLTANGPTTMSSVTSTNWAGGVYSYPQVGVLRACWYSVLMCHAQNSIKAVTATFTLPKPRTPPGGNSNTQYYSSAWVGIDGASCTSAILQTGVDMDVQGSSVSYSGEPRRHTRCAPARSRPDAGSVVRVVPRRRVRLLRHLVQHGRLRLAHGHRDVEDERHGRDHEQLERAERHARVLRRSRSLRARRRVDN
jgi:hypothetical protein